MEKIKMFEKQYKKLENEFLTYSDLKKIKTNENWEEFVEIPELDNLWWKYFKDDMKKYFNWKIIKLVGKFIFRTSTKVLKFDFPTSLLLEKQFEKN